MTVVWKEFYEMVHLGEDKDTKNIASMDMVKRAMKNKKKIYIKRE